MDDPKRRIEKRFSGFMLTVLAALATAVAYAVIVHGSTLERAFHWMMPIWLVVWGAALVARAIATRRIAAPTDSR